MSNHRLSHIVVCVALISTWVTVAPTQADKQLAPESRTNGAETLASVTELGKNLAAVTVEIFDEDRKVALGTVVSQDGLIVTKASELGWNTTVRLPDDRRVNPIEVAVDADNDLALLRLDVEFAKFAKLFDTDNWTRGRFLISPADTRSDYRIGIVSANTRTIKRQGGVLGVSLRRESPEVEGVEVFRVYSETGAQQAGVSPGDIIQTVQGVPVKSVTQLQQIVNSHFPGEVLTLALKRGDQTLQLNVTLGFRSDYFGHLDRNQRLSGRTSSRRSGFQEILQHDIPIEVSAMGAPVADLQGRIVGINIARVDRVCAYALPSSLVRRVLDEFGEALPQPE